MPRPSDRITRFRTDFAARRSKGLAPDTSRKLSNAGTPPDVTSVRAKSQRHRKSTADKMEPVSSAG